MGQLGESCTETCFNNGMNCNTAITAGNTSALTEMQKLGIDCKANPKPWWAENQPGFVNVSTDPNYGECLGYTDVPAGVVCSASFPTVRRLCRCDVPSKTFATFGTAESSSSFGVEESHVFSWVLADGDTGSIRHFWITYSGKTDPGTLIRFYVDGETEASIVFEPSLAAGVGFYDQSAPKGNRYISKGAADGSWNFDVPIPFAKSIRMTTQHTTGGAGYYVIVRGSTNTPIVVSGLTVPPTGKLVQTRVNNTFQPLQYFPVASAPAGSSGFFFMLSLQFTSGNLNILEGCFHMYTSPDQDFPGILLSSGGEDYFNSGWYFSAGEFFGANAGMTHLVKSDGSVELSAFRIHDMDPLVFNDGFRIDWRIGDNVDPAGIKCMIADGNGRTVGSPTPSQIKSYGWAYVW